MTPFDAILFDFDGVLIDSEPLHCPCWAEVLKPLGVTLEWEFYRDHCIGIDDREMLRMMATQSDPPRDWQELWAQYPAKKELFRDRTLNAPPFDPALEGFLAALHGKYKMAVVTSSARAEIEPLLQAGGLRGYFDDHGLRQGSRRAQARPGTVSDGGPPAGREQAVGSGRFPRRVLPAAGPPGSRCLPCKAPRMSRS